MNIFNIFKTQEEIYYSKFKKLVGKVNKEITISNLKVRVMSLQIVIDDLTKQNNELESTLNDLIKNRDDVGVKNILNKKEDLKLKLTVLFKIQHECENDFIRGVTLKVKDLIENETLTAYFNHDKIHELLSTPIPSNYKQCIIFSDRMSRLFGTSGRGVTSEIIKNF